MNVDAREHWDDVWSSRAADSVSWFQPDARLSLALVTRLAPSLTSSVVDVGGGASPLVGQLHALGYRDLTLVDVSSFALQQARAGLASAVADDIEFVAADITEWRPSRTFDVWHDRALFHFLLTEEHQRAYASAVSNAVPPGGHLVIGVFAANGPTMCSGLPVVRRGADELAAVFDPDFELLGSTGDDHTTPDGRTQEFVFATFRRR